MNLDRNLKIIDPRITPIANFELTIKICELIVKCDKFKVVKKGANESFHYDKKQLNVLLMVLLKL